ncbi:MAG: FAD-dependent monooxygenase [Myxococcales bacterium]|nr:FAD-dependent monooxygenase [Myxococcales bacterium]MCB9641969.1 FAD-dependent monooxygenase [Myxococcales bacterium]
MRVDVAIVGAGVAGAALATVLGRAGFQVALIDRTAKIPEVIAGELLQPGGYQALESLGLEDAVGEIDAQKVIGFSVLQGEDGQALAYPKRSDIKDSPLPETKGYAFRHHRFVGRLRAMAQQTPNVHFCIGHVSNLDIQDDRVRGLFYRNAEGQEQHIEAYLTVAADGRGSKLRPQLSKGAEPEQVSYSIGVLLRDVELPFPQHGHVFLTQPAPTLAYPIGTNAIRLLVDFPGPLPKQSSGEMADYLLNELLPQMPSSLHESLRQAVADNAIQTMQNIRMRPPTPTLKGAVLLGDAYNMRHPMTGSGMTVALNDVRQLATLLQETQFHHADALDTAIRSFYRKRESLAATVDMLAGALYEIFRAEDATHALMRDAVLRYWQLGGIAVSGPMSLLSGMAPKPSLLLAHFFAVAFIEAGQRLLRAPSRPLQIARELQDAFRLIVGAFAIIQPQLRRGMRLLLPNA